MQTLIFPEEQDFRRCVREVVMECLEKTAAADTASGLPGEETLLNRKQAAMAVHNPDDLTAEELMEIADYNMGLWLELKTN
nr:hypothetical protein [uncultured Flavobacterium sp.]